MMQTGLSGYWHTHNLWITWSPKCGLTTMNHLYTDYKKLHKKNYNCNDDTKIITIIRNPLERAISIFNYNMYRLPYTVDGIDRLNERESEPRYYELFKTIRKKYPDPPTSWYNDSIDETKFLFWLNEILPISIENDGHSMRQNTSWQYPNQLQTRSKYWTLENLNKHLLKVFGYTSNKQYQNFGKYNKEKMTTLLSLPNVKKKLIEYYYTDNIIYNTAKQKYK